ncbi:hypothetical protein L1049_020948 [Liquidambar formosana]|uniref:Reverse transcriptase zinc-binding domain-containing protein n=1 Tax=Liquidambar formosana TaxID=63359 RepID=A0AAP0SDV6_LIQFO
MIRLDLKSGLHQPIAWIDESGGFFFPENFSSDDDLHYCWQHVCGKDQEILFREPYESHEIKLQLGIDINGADPSECGESNAFVKQIQFDQKRASNQYDWCSSHSVTAANCPRTSVNYSDVDENGVRYMIFCRVIMGNMELVRAGSKQFLPSSEDFESGVADLKNPRYYIVWNMNMYDEALGTRIMYDDALPSQAKVSTIISHRTWLWPLSISAELLELQSSIPSNFRPNSEINDKIVWLPDPLGIFSSRSAWNAIRQHKPEVDWHKVVWFSKAIKKHAFILWLIILNRINAKDMLLNWGIISSATCVLCNTHIETRDHLFITCRFA